MGIKGIYGEIGPGERIALSKLAVQKFEETGRPFRIAIDISIWQFQIQSGQGGSNPALRTLYYRLLRLVSLSIQPLFVFDGAHKPALKRDRRTYPNSGALPNLLAKQLLDLFGFPYHIAPGEAEAECALFQREGIVDAVLSEDVDTLMFGCGISLRNWSNEGKGKTPTHVSLYEAEKTRNGRSGLDREGMVLVAMMSGGDYNTAGVPGCGIKVACQAARAGFGMSLCSLKDRDAAGFKAWRESLVHELQTNESKHFRTKHKALQIPESFPDKTVLRYYTHPAVSSARNVQSLKSQLNWDKEINIAALRSFVAEAFDWRFRPGAKKLIRGLAPAMVVQKLRVRSTISQKNQQDSDDFADEFNFVQAVCGKRENFDADGLEELRIRYVPLEVVGLDLDDEASDDGYEYGGQDSDDDEESTETGAPAGDVEASDAPLSPTKKRLPPTYDPTRAEKLWVLGTYVRRGVPHKVKDWEEALQKSKKGTAPKTTSKRATRKPKHPAERGTMDRFVKITKPGLASRSIIELDKDFQGPESSSLDLPPVCLAPSISSSQSESTVEKFFQEPPNTPKTREKQGISPSNATAKHSPRKVIPAKEHSVQKPSKSNPWTLSRRPPDNGARSDRVKRKLDFLPPGLHLDRHLADLDDDELPELSFPAVAGSTFPRREHSSGPVEQAIEISSSPPEASRVTELPLPTKTLNARRLVALRESLEGAWKEVDENEAQTRASVWKDVEVVDLSQK